MLHLNFSEFCRSYSPRSCPTLWQCRIFPGPQSIHQWPYMMTHRLEERSPWLTVIAWPSWPPLGYGPVNTVGMTGIASVKAKFSTAAAFFFQAKLDKSMIGRKHGRPCGRTECSGQQRRWPPVRCGWHLQLLAHQQFEGSGVGRIEGGHNDVQFVLHFAVVRIKSVSSHFSTYSCAWFCHT